jgi:glycosyltransferase involved in cell wall biosynthesis
MKTLAIFHLSTTSGPSKTLRPSLERLASKGSLDVLVPAPERAGPGTVAAEYEDMATVTPMPYEVLALPGGLLGAPRLALRLLRELRAFRARLRERRPDLVVVATGVLPAAVMAARLERIPVIVRVAEIFDRGDVGGPARSIGGRLLTRFLRRNASAIVCSSRLIARQFGDDPHVPVVTIHPGIDDSHAGGDGAAFRARLGLEDAYPLVAVVGNITRARGQDLALRAMLEVAAGLPGAHLLIAGAPHDRPADMDYLTELEATARAPGLAGHVTFAGFVPEVADVYAAADLLLNPARFNEPFGRVALEALLAGCPVLATKVGAIPELLHDGRDSVLVPPEDPGAIAREIAALAGDPARAEKLARSGRDRVRAEFGTERVAAEFEEIAALVTP